MINSKTSRPNTIHAYVCAKIFYLAFILIFSANLIGILSVAHAESFEELPQSTSLAPNVLSPKIGGMHTMTITPKPQKLKTQEQESSISPQTLPPDQKEEIKSNLVSKDELPQKKIDAGDYIPLPMDKILIKEEDFSDWPYTNLIRPIKNAAQKNALIAAIESDRSHVSPQILFLSAQVLHDAGDHKYAALYLLVGQSRLNFDQARFPGKLKDEKKADDHARITAQQNKNKSPDQALPNYSSSTIPITSAHRGVQNLSNSISPPIYQWLVKHPSDMKEITAAAQAWDAATPYAYYLGYETGSPVPFDQWAKILRLTRSRYFSSLQEFQNALGGV